MPLTTIDEQRKADVEELCQRLLHRAGYVNDAQIPRGGEHNTEFRAILDTLAYIGARKVDEYGDFRLQDIRNYDRETWGAYWDIQRKFGRLESQLRQRTPNTDLMETLADQAVYCVRMIQILKRLEEKEMATP